MLAKGIRTSLAFASLMPEDGKYKLDVNHDILNSRWQFRQMGFGSNVQRRLPKIYDLPKAKGEAAYRPRAISDFLRLERNAWRSISPYGS